MAHGRAPIEGRAAFVLVLLVWAGMLAGAIAFVLAFAPPFPVGDEFALWTLLPPHGGLTGKALWSLHNEHRIPLPRLLHALPYLLTGDLRAAMVAQALLLGAVALGLVLLARRIRGRSSLSDTLFPLLFLHVGNWTNLLSGFQIALTLPVALVCAILAGIAVSPEPPSPRRAALTGACLVCLPLCGAVGLCQAPVLGAWLAWAAACAIRAGDRGRKRAGWTLLGFVGLAAALCVLYFVGYRQPPWYSYSTDLGPILGLGAAVLALALGPAADAAWPASGAFVLLILATTIALLAIGSRRDPRERLRILGLLAVLGAVGCLAAAIGYGRGSFGWRHGFVERFVTLMAPFLACAHLSWMMYGGPIGRPLVCGALALAAALSLPLNARVGLRQGRELRERVERFEDLVGRKPAASELVSAFQELFPPHMAQKSRRILETLAEARKPPFDGGFAPSGEEFRYLTFSRVPLRVEPADLAVPRFLDGMHVLAARAGTAVHLERHAGDRRIRGAFGIPSEAVRPEWAPRIRVLVETVDPAGPPRVLLDRTLDPAVQAGDRGRQAFDLDVPTDRPGEIVLRTEPAGGMAAEWSTSYWSDVVIEGAAAIPPSGTRSSPR